MGSDKAAGPKPMSKTEILNSLAESSGLNKKQVSTVLENLSGLIQNQLSDDGPGVFSIPGLVKVKVVHKPATPERQGKHPFTGEPTVFKAKPAKKIVKAQPLKPLKDMVA